MTCSHPRHIDIPSILIAGFQALLSRSPEFAFEPLPFLPGSSQQLNPCPASQHPPDTHTQQGLEWTAAPQL